MAALTAAGVGGLGLVSAVSGSAASAAPSTGSGETGAEDLVTNGSTVLVVDGDAELQAWVDALVTAARAGGSGWPHGHANVPAAQTTKARVWRAIEDAYAAAGTPWSIVESGLPPWPSLDEASARPAGEYVRFDRGSIYHNVLHGLLGDFH